MRSLLLLAVALCFVLPCGCQTITSDRAVFAPEKLDLPLDRLEGSWTDPNGDTFVIRRVAPDRFVIEAEDEIPLPITLLSEGGMRVDRPPEDGVRQPPIFVDLHKVEEGYLLVTSESEAMRGRDLSGLIHVRAKFDRSLAEVEIGLFSGSALYDRLEKAPDLLAHEKNRGEKGDGERRIVTHVTIRLKDDPAKIRRYILDHLNDAELFMQGDEEEALVYRRLGDLPASRPATRDAR